MADLIRAKFTDDRTVHPITCPKCGKDFKRGDRYLVAPNGLFNVSLHIGCAGDSVDHGGEPPWANGELFG